MKYFKQVVPLAALASAYVIVDDKVMHQVSLEAENVRHETSELFDKLASSAGQLYDQAWEGTLDVFDQFASPAEDFYGNIRDKLANVVEASHDALGDCVHSISNGFEDVVAQSREEYESLKDEWEADGHRGRHGRHGRHGHHQPSNLTIYQMITKSKYTTKLAALINEYDDLVQTLNSTKANFTVFAPTDKAFEKIPDHGKKPPRELVEKVLLYHVVPGLNTAWPMLSHHTLPTLLRGEGLSEHPKRNPQRLTVKLGWTGLYIDSYSKVIYPNIRGTNGVVHAVDNILVPPPPIPAIIKFSPTAFSTYTLAVKHAGLKKPQHLGGTLFAPPNPAWSKLGWKVNAFLFSEYGRKYLRAILQYGAVVNQTLYSDVFYGPPGDEDSQVLPAQESTENVPKGVYHLDLPTLLHDKLLGVDIARWGGFIEIKINAFTRVVFQDAIARDGVIQVVNNVLIPPRKIGNEEVHYDGEELTVEDLKERLAPYVSEDEGEDWENNLEL